MGGDSLCQNFVHRFGHISVRGESHEVATARDGRQVVPQKSLITPHLVSEPGMKRFLKELWKVSLNLLTRKCRAIGDSFHVRFCGAVFYQYSMNLRIPASWSHVNEKSILGGEWFRRWRGFYNLRCPVY